MAASTKLKFLYILGFMDIFAFILFVPLLFDHLRSLGVSILTIGLLTSLHSGLQLICSPIIGSWSDFRGRGSILQVLLIICATFYSVLGYTTSFPIILLCRIIHGICEHTQMLCGTLLAEIVSPEKYSEVQGRMASIAAMGFIVGPIIGGHLAEYENGFQYTCYIVALIFTINFVIVRTFLTSSPHDKSKKKSGKQKLPNKKTDRKTDKEKKSVTSEIFHAARQLKNIDWEMYWDIFAFKFLCDFTCGLHYQNLRIVLKDVYNVTPTWIGYGMAITGICGAVTGFQNGWISKLYKNDRNHAHKAFHSCCIFVLSYVLLGISPNLVFVMMSLMLHSASYSIIGITISEIILLKTTSDKRGSISGTAQSMFSLSKLIAPVASGIVYEIHGMTGIATAKVLVASAALVLSLYLFKTKTQDKVKMT